jgi:hypothetical protein
LHNFCPHQQPIYTDSMSAARTATKFRLWREENPLHSVSDPNIFGRRRQFLTYSVQHQIYRVILTTLTYFWHSAGSVQYDGYRKNFVCIVVGIAAQKLNLSHY